MTEFTSDLMQTTLQRPAEFAGIGLFTGQPCAIRMIPIQSNSGIVFHRVDLPGSPEIPATLKYVAETPRCTRLAKGSASVQMVEHLLSALRGCGVDNVRIDVRGPEIPVGDGSARQFVHLIESAGITQLEEARAPLRITKPICWSQGETHLVALPFPGFRISYTLHYPHSPLIRTQYTSQVMTEQFYKSEIAPCRTFSLYEEIMPMMERGLLKGGGLENALVIQGDRVLNPGGARFPDEMVRHKVLDLIGDLALLGAPIEGHVISIRSGHAANVAFAKEIEEALINSGIRQERVERRKPDPKSLWLKRRIQKAPVEETI
jgi:UDP-3-O-[3-hydroxymyristoyl] N-acetylglucosamine deacetylase